MADVSSPYRDFLSLEARITTFSSWPNSVDIFSLAAAGFVFTGSDDVVICPFCKVEGFRWLSTDDPMADHERWSPGCPYVLAKEKKESRFRRDVLRNLGIQAYRPPVHRSKCTIASRMATFRNWPEGDSKPRPTDLAEAGFFYAGADDRTVCFHCGGGLMQWKGDDAWQQHAVWFSECVYLTLKRGEDFVRKQKTAAFETTSTIVDVENVEETTPEVDRLAARLPATPEPVDPLSGTKSCKICYDEDAAVLLLPCRHVVTCVDCTTTLEACPVCRGDIEAIAKIFM